MPCLYPVLPGAVAVRGRAAGDRWDKIAAVASRKQVMTPQRIGEDERAIDRKIAEYLASMDEAIGRSRARPASRVDVAAAIEALKGQKERLQAQAQDLAARAEAAGYDRTGGEADADAAWHAVAYKRADSGRSAKAKLNRGFRSEQRGQRTTAASSDGGRRQVAGSAPTR